MWKSTRAVAALASALRAGPVKRRQMLKELSRSDFLDVLPLWIGTLQEIDNTLPVTPGMFDVVIFDEASQIDQMRAAPALARAKRTIVVGIPDSCVMCRLSQTTLSRPRPPNTACAGNMPASSTSAAIASSMRRRRFRR
jgi:hypothetical protein